MMCVYHTLMLWVHVIDSNYWVSCILFTISWREYLGKEVGKQAIQHLQNCVRYLLTHKRVVSNPIRIPTWSKGPLKGETAMTAMGCPQKHHPPLILHSRHVQGCWCI